MVIIISKIKNIKTNGGDVGLSQNDVECIVMKVITENTQIHTHICMYIMYANVWGGGGGGVKLIGQYIGCNFHVVGIYRVWMPYRNMSSA